MRQKNWIFINTDMKTSNLELLKKIIKYQQEEETKISGNFPLTEISGKVCSVNFYL
jgi:hypothetical protein